MSPLQIQLESWVVSFSSFHQLMQPIGYLIIVPQQDVEMLLKAGFQTDVTGVHMRMRWIIGTRIQPPTPTHTLFA